MNGRMRLLLFVGVVPTFFTFFLSGGAQFTKSVSLWRTHVFKLLPEYRGSVAGIRAQQSAFQHKLPDITFEVFETIIKKCIDITEKQLAKDFWILPKPVVSVDTIPAYVQKYQIPSGSPIFVQGDVHGSVHAFLRNLRNAREERKNDLGLYIANNFVITSNTHSPAYFVSLGDTVDRGRYSVESLITLCLVKIANPERAFLIRGNHDGANYPDGFGDECAKKFGNQGEAAHALVEKLFRLCPTAVYLVHGKDVLLFCHGAMPGTEIFNPKDLIKYSKPIAYQGISSDAFEKFVNTYVYDVTNDMVSRLNAVNGQIKPKEIRAVFCGHAHGKREGGFKFFIRDGTNLNYVGVQNVGAHIQGRPTEGLVSSDLLYKDLSLQDYGAAFPVYDLTTPTEANGDFVDCFGIIKTKPNLTLRVEQRAYEKIGVGSFIGGYCNMVIAPNYSTREQKDDIYSWELDVHSLGYITSGDAGVIPSLFKLQFNKKQFEEVIAPFARGVFQSLRSILTVPKPAKAHDESQFSSLVKFDARTQAVLNLIDGVDAVLKKHADWVFDREEASDLMQTPQGKKPALFADETQQGAFERAYNKFWTDLDGKLKTLGWRA